MLVDRRLRCAVMLMMHGHDHRLERRRAGAGGRAGRGDQAEHGDKRKQEVPDARHETILRPLRCADNVPLRCAYFSAFAMLRCAVTVGISPSAKLFSVALSPEAE